MLTARCCHVQRAARGLDVMHALAARITGEAILRILCKKTDRLVGYLSQWNKGDLQPAWLNDAMAEVRYEPIIDSA